MSIPDTVYDFLAREHIPYQTIRHQPSKSSVQSAIAARIPLHRLAKAVVLKDSLDHYLMAILPAANRVNIHQVGQITNSKLQFATEHELNCRFKDCEPGAIPPFGEPYHMDVLWDTRLRQSPDVFLEAGDHETLIRLLQENFQQISNDQPHDDLCSAPPGNH